jgi:predicted amidohydrolase
MTPFRLALANVRAAADREESVRLAVYSISGAGAAGARLIAFPECFVPGYRWRDRPSAPPDQRFLERAWAELGAACAKAGVAAVVGTERVVEGDLRITALILDERGDVAGFQDKVQLDPSEEPTYAPGAGRRLFRVGPLTLGVAICHEGWRYPETVRWAARRGAQLVVHPHLHVAEPGGFRPTTFADPRNSFHEKAILCRAAENTCWVATVNAASEGSPTTSAIARPDGTLLAHQPYGVEGLLVADLDLDEATRSLAARCKVLEYGE